MHSIYLGLNVNHEKRGGEINGRGKHKKNGKT